MLEFGFGDDESQNLGRFSLCRVSCLDTHFIRQTRLPDPLSDLCSKLNLSDRYYLKDLTETAPLGEFVYLFFIIKSVLKLWWKIPAKY